MGDLQETYDRILKRGYYINDSEKESFELCQELIREEKKIYKLRGDVKELSGLVELFKDDYDEFMGLFLHLGILPSETIMRRNIGYQIIYNYEKPELCNNHNVDRVYNYLLNRFNENRLSINDFDSNVTPF